MLEVPLFVVTRTSVAPTLPAGATAVICVSLSMLNEVASVEPNLTAVAPAKLVPVMKTTRPPAVEPEAGDSPATLGDDAAAKVNWSALDVLDVPPPVVTVTWTVAADCAGLQAVIDVALLTTKYASTLPNFTPVAEVKLVPVISTR